jgi:hypothetical protein
MTPRVQSGSPFEARIGFCRALRDPRWKVEIEAEAQLDAS